MLSLRRKSRTLTAPLPPEGIVDGLPSSPALYPERPKPRGLLRYSSKSLFHAVFWSLAASALINAASLKGAVLTAVSGVDVVCQAVNHTFGDPLGKLKEKLGLGGNTPRIVIGSKTPEQQAADDARERAELVAEADALNLSWREDWPLAKLRVEVREAKKRKLDADRTERDRVAEERREEKRQREAEEKARKERERAEERAQEEAAERAGLTARATAVNFGVNALLPLPEMRRQVEVKEAEAEADADYQLKHRRWEKAMAAYEERLTFGKNAVCPSCGMRMNISPDANSMKAVMCIRCKYVAARAVFRAGFNPPPPPVEPEPPGGGGSEGGKGILSRLTGGFE